MGVKLLGEKKRFMTLEWPLNFFFFNNGRNGSCLTWLATSLEEKRRWLVINASPRGQCSK